MVPIRRQPRSISTSVASRSPGDVVDVDVRHPVTRRPGPAAEDAGQVEPGHVLGEAVVAVVGDHQRAVDVPVGEVAQGARRRGAGTREQQHELDVALAEHAGHAAQGAGEERVGEDPVVGLGHDDRDRVGTPRDEAARRGVGDVAERAHRGVDRGLRAGTDPLAAVDGAGRGGAGDAGDPGDLVEGGRPRRRALPRPVHAGHGSHSAGSAAGRPPCLDTSAYQRALDFGVRACVS